jgi:hypothetical protein
MRSSVAVAGRALIMLGCTAGLVLWALWGASWPDTLKKLQDFRLPAILDIASASTSSTAPASLGEAPRFSSSVASKSAPTVCIPGPPASANIPKPLDITSSPTALQAPMSSLQQSAVVPAGYQTPANSSGNLPFPGWSADSNAVSASLTADPFHAIQERLRQLGATYYLLESWGSEQQVYRFYCKMAIGGSADYTRCFEATNADPLQAMQQVLQQVEAQHDGLAMTRDP